MKQLFLAAVAAIACSVSLSGQTEGGGSDLTPDPALHSGSLPNGLRYVILPNREPRERVSLRLVVLCGSIDERDGQRGLAHYLEHMAFNGSTHFAPGSLVGYFQRNGMRFGGDANASTSYLSTNYRIDLPDHRPESIRGALEVLGDFAGGLLLSPAMVDKERPVILAEKRTRDSAVAREFVATQKFLLPDALYPHRVPIGDAGDIERVTCAQLQQIYNNWYRPERMFLLVVGDIDPSVIAAQVATAFAGLKARAPVPSEPDLGHVSAPEGLQVGFVSEPTASGTTVGIYVTAPYPPQPDTIALRRERLIRQLAVLMMDRRLSALGRKPEAPFSGGRLNVRTQYGYLQIASIELGSSRRDWQTALGVAEQELRRALRYGFTAQELREAVAIERNAYQTAADGAATRLSSRLIETIEADLIGRRITTSPAAELALATAVLDQVTPALCLEALQHAFPGSGRKLFVRGNFDASGDVAARIADIYHRAEAVAVTARADTTDAVFGYADFGSAGRILKQTRVDDLDITEVQFANGVRLNLKRTEFQAGRVDVTVRVGGGLLSMPPTERGLDIFADLGFLVGGLGKHSNEELRAIVAGKSIQERFRVRNDCFQFTASTASRDLPLALQLMTARIADPGFRPEAAGVAGRAIATLTGTLFREPTGPLMATVPSMLASGDGRLGVPPYPELKRRNMAELKAWLTSQFASGAIEIGIVGDFDVAAAIERVAHTYGALPQRAEKPDYAAERQIDFPAKPFMRTFLIRSDTPKAAVAAYWPSADIWDLELTRKLELLSSIFRDRLRLRLRERMGAAYSVSAADHPNDAFTGYGTIQVMAIVAPNRADECGQAILAVAKEILEQGVTAEELDRAREPELAAIRDAVRTNAYWSDRVLYECQEYPQVLDRHRTHVTSIAAITAEQLTAVARQYLTPEKAFRFKVVPIAAATKPMLTAPKPLYRDPVYDGAADPTVIWSSSDRAWFMFYTVRRANVAGLNGVAWVHGTPIGIAASTDGGVTWKYRQQARIHFPGAVKDATYWAPAVVEDHGLFHMFVTYVPGAFADGWNHPRDILHLTSRNLTDWEYRGTLPLAHHKDIDPGVLHLPDGTWRLWYKDEADGSSCHFADSPDLDHWTDRGRSLGLSDIPGEAPLPFHWQGSYWLMRDITHRPNGIAVYRSADALDWKRVGTLLQTPGTGKDDGAVGHHPEVILSEGRAYLFYFTHPDARGTSAVDGNARRSSMQVTELHYDSDRKILTADRDQPTQIHLAPPADIETESKFEAGRPN